MSAAKSHKPLAVAEWPELDREVWRKAQEAGDEFSGTGIAAKWAPRSRANAELAYGRLLGFLQRNGRLHPVDRVGDRLVADDLCGVGRELSTQLAPFTVLGFFGSLGMAFKAMDATADRSLLNEFVSRLSLTARTTRDITGNLVPPAQLVTIGLSMMDGAEKQTPNSWRRASLYRDGLLTMFMALCPLRPGAATEMQIGTHLIIRGDNVSVRLAPEEGKKRRVAFIPLTDDLQSRFLRYIKYYRPMFPAPPPQHAHALWISRNGNPLDRDGLSKRIKERMGRRVGKRFTAHMFRHAAATYIVDVVPERSAMIVGVLGHAGFRTAKRHYIKGEQHMAMRKFQDAVKGVVKRGRGRRTRKS